MHYDAFTPTPLSRLPTFNSINYRLFHTDNICIDSAPPTYILKLSTVPFCIYFKTIPTYKLSIVSFCIYFQLYPPTTYNIQFDNFTVYTWRRVTSIQIKVNNSSTNFLNNQFIILLIKNLKNFYISYILIYNS